MNCDAQKCASKVSIIPRLITSRAVQRAAAAREGSYVPLLIAAPLAATAISPGIRNVAQFNYAVPRPGYYESPCLFSSCVMTYCQTTAPAPRIEGPVRVRKLLFTRSRASDLRQRRALRFAGHHISGRQGARFIFTGSGETDCFLASETLRPLPIYGRVQGWRLRVSSILHVS